MNFNSYEEAVAFAKTHGKIIPRHSGSLELFEKYLVDKYIIKINSETMILRLAEFEDDSIKQGIRHNLDGPSIIDRKSGFKSYFINDKYLSYWNWKKHPLVVENNIKKILGELLDE